MTPTQEVCNAATMLLPAAILFSCCSKIHPARTRADVLFLGTCMHLPCSLAYHLRCACTRTSGSRRRPSLEGNLQGEAQGGWDRVDNDLRRLDQSMQHAVAPLFAYALSHGSWFYAACNVPLNVYGIVKLWDASTCNDGKRWRLVGLSMAMYMLPMAARRDWCNLAGAAGSVVVGGMLFHPCVNVNVLGGWGHCLFHACMGGLALALARSVQS